jgi:hypothetical protein
MSVTAQIESLSADQRLPRSSHSLAVISNTLYILGGEVQPREPASPLVHAYDLKSICFVVYVDR